MLEPSTGDWTLPLFSFCLLSAIVLIVVNRVSSTLVSSSKGVRLFFSSADAPWASLCRLSWPFTLRCERLLFLRVSDRPCLFAILWLSLCHLRCPPGPVFGFYLCPWILASLLFYAFRAWCECIGVCSVHHLQFKPKETPRAPGFLLIMSSTHCMSQGCGYLCYVCFLWLHFDLFWLPRFGPETVSWVCHFRPILQSIDDLHFCRSACQKSKSSDREGSWFNPQAHRYVSFDSTKGFPGEGPTDFKLVSANIGSLNTNQLWKSWNADITCLQETRVGKTNFRTASKAIEACGMRPVFGDLLPGLWHPNGTTKTPCGGTAILGSDVAIQPFEASQDATELYDSLFKSKRVVAAWYQLTPKTRGLFFSVYATTGASSDNRVHETNDCLFEKIFHIAAQFGQIPIAIAGDFQANPSSYASVASAMQFHGWFDPLNTTDDDGGVSRPYTYSKDCSFSGADEGCTSIDAVLLNNTAFCAVRDACVLEHFGRQHRPIQVTFNWPSIEQYGFIHLKFAPLDVSYVPDPETCQDDTGLWESKFAKTFDEQTAIDDKWLTVNQYFQEVLLSRGARWGEGSKMRATTPVFSPKRICPTQLRSNCAATKVSLEAYKLINRLNELAKRVSRPPGSPHDVFNTRQLAIRAYRALGRLNSSIWWVDPMNPTLVEVHLTRRWAESFATTLDGHTRLKRIRSWKDKIKNSEHQGYSFIFQHLRNKASEEPPNLVLNDQGQILTQPEEAIQELNRKWDDIFAANVLADHPLKMLETVWPYISDKQVQAHLPPISGEALYHVIKKRKTNAAPGLDGWRTVELQALPKKCFDVLAVFFQLIEDSDHPLPKALTFAKQVILNKPGPASPINKRLITVLPPLLLAYTGARYAQLQSWQIQAMPAGIVGGVKGRYMSSLYNDVRLDLDIANLEDDTIVGVKLDKSKAFDRIIPQFAACLFVAFGIPQHVVKVFLKVYQNLHKHLAYRNWTSPVATTHANGVAQGCSFSILAMNSYNKVWYHLLEYLPGIVIRAYIDDSYLWCRLANIQSLQTAIKVTQVWDQLAGQKLNISKSSMWSNTTQGRASLKKTFADFPVTLEFETLGARIYTSSRCFFGFTEGSLKKILADIENIGALPVSVATKVFLVGAKVIPRLTFGSHISRVPKTKLDVIQNTIARCLWGRRPKWRSKWLVQSIFGKPYRTDPRTACAYHTVMEVIRSCHSNPQLFPKLLKTHQANQSAPHSLIGRFQQACDFLHIQLTETLALSFCNSQPISLAEITPQDSCRIFQAIARDACYRLAGSTPRKDFLKTAQVFDHAMSTLLLRTAKVHGDDGVTNHHRFESVLVGCCLTNDRMAATGWSDTATCRFCGEEKETLHHLVHQCNSLHRMIGIPVLHEVGRNFAVLGHVHQPTFVVRRRLLQLQACTLPIAHHYDPTTTAKVWTDGSLVFGDNIWLATGTYAILDEHQVIIQKGQVSHLSLSAYTTELWAIIVACTIATTRLQIYSDCLAVVRQAQRVFGGYFPDPSWRCYHWWGFLADVVARRSAVCDTPFQVEWIPAHQYEHIPIQLVTEDMARCVHTTWQHIANNRLVDRAAREYAVCIAPVDPGFKPQLLAAIQSHQEWLVNVHALLPTHDPEHEAPPTVQELPDTLTLAQCKLRYPQWPWDTPATQYKWKPKIPLVLPCPESWKWGAENWHVICGFLRSLQWKEDRGASFSFCELAAVFHSTGSRIKADSDLLTFRELTNVIRKAMLLLSKNPSVQAFPGSFNSTRPRSCGRVLPQGCIDYALPYVRPEGYELVANLLARGANRTLESWEIPVCDF